MSNFPHPYEYGPQVDYTWSANFTLEQPAPVSDIIKNQLGSLVMSYADPNWPVSGAVLGSGDTNRNQVILGLDPSGSFGTPTFSRCETIAADITGKLGWHRYDIDRTGIRVLLGRRIGYDGKEYSMNDTRSIIAANADEHLSLTEADIFSLRYVDGLQEYHEPGVIVEGSAVHLPSVLGAAAAMGQIRLVAELNGYNTQVYRQPVTD